MADKSEFKNKQKCQKSLKRKKLHARKLPLLQYFDECSTTKSCKLCFNLNYDPCLGFFLGMIFIVKEEECNVCVVCCNGLWEDLNIFSDSVLQYKKNSKFSHGLKGLGL